jgi:DUF1680 family protein
MRRRYRNLPLHTVVLLPLAERPRLVPSLFQERAALNRRYLMSLASENLLQNYYLEAGLWATRGRPEGIHWGWESPTCQLRGHFLGHWLSAAARLSAATGDAEVKAKADHIVAELARCQAANGGEWAGSIPEKYFDWLARGRWVWAPHYTVHKTLMGLFEMYAFAGNQQALEILVRWARWFHRWTGQFSRAQLDDILDVETGGMLEVWADLYAVTGEREHRELLERYDRPRLFERLLEGVDVLTNQHANTTIPEVHGAARAWEVTGVDRWRRIAEAYWRQAVTERGFYCTGGQTCGEFWTPPNALAARLGEKTQEHCTVYNMMRLAEYLYRWTGEVAYLDYWERNLYNGILAQQHPQTGMVSYFLPLAPGATKNRTTLPREEKTTWGHPTEDFWCCHGTLVQAHAAPGASVYYETDDGLVVAQYVPTTARWRFQGVPITVTQTHDPQLDRPHRPSTLAIDLHIHAERPVAFRLQIRLPWWLKGTPTLTLNGARLAGEFRPTSYATIERTWQDDRLRLELPRGLTVCPLPDDPERVAFLDGPVVLAGLCEDELTLYGDREHPETFLVPDNEREWRSWKPGYRTRGQERNLRFLPLYEIIDEHYTVYFPLRGNSTRA